jgi:hypothetical protein
MSGRTARMYDKSIWNESHYGILNFLLNKWQVRKTQCKHVKCDTSGLWLIISAQGTSATLPSIDGKRTCKPKHILFSKRMELV